jgi:hypothetical protein
VNVCFVVLFLLVAQIQIDKLHLPTHSLHTHLLTTNKQTHTHTHTHKHMHLWTLFQSNSHTPSTNTCRHTHKFTHAHTHTHTLTFSQRANPCLDKQTHTHTYTHTQTHTHTHTCTHIHTSHASTLPTHLLEKVRADPQRRSHPRKKVSSLPEYTTCGVQ